MTFNDTKKELISVAVITYNSSKTVIETLDSILKQTYGSESIELVISDDASIDDTVEVIDVWLRCNEKKFHDVLFFKNECNVGVSGNVNISWKACSSEWIKTIAGDDILSRDCLIDNMKYIKNNSECQVVSSAVTLFKKSIYENNVKIKTPYFFYNYTPDKQYESLLLSNKILAPSVFVNKSIILQFGGADEKYRMIEDWPMWLKITKGGVKIYGFDKVTVYYREGESVSKGYENIINLLYLDSYNKIYDNLIFKELYKINKLEYIDRKLHLLSLNFKVKICNNKKTILSKVLYFFIMSLSPLYLYRLLLGFIKGV